MAVGYIHYRALDVHEELLGSHSVACSKDLSCRIDAVKAKSLDVCSAKTEAEKEYPFGSAQHFPRFPKLLIIPIGLVNNLN
jgi:hypothetical protein